MKYDSEWDVIVVGAGPGGSKAAWEFAKRGNKTLLVDRKQQIGPPKRCGEGISIWVIEEVAGLKATPDIVKQEIDGGILIAPNGKEAVVHIPEGGTGAIIERSQFEKKLAAEAIRAGAKVMLKCDVFDVIKNDGYVEGIRARHEGKNIDLKCKILVGSDGVDSTIGRLAGLKTTMPPSECDSGYQYEMANLPLKDQRKIELYFGNDIAPRGYVWIFPKGDDVANVGIGINGSMEHNAKYYLDKWIDSNHERFKNASILEINAGVIPVTQGVRQMVDNGIMLLGDAARMVNPIHGGGMATALEAAIMAGEVGSAAIKGGDVSFERLKEYQDMWWKKRGNQYKKVLKVRHFFEKINDEQLNIIRDVVEDTSLYLDLAEGKNLSQVAKMLLKASPKGAKFAMSFIKN